VPLYYFNVYNDDVTLDDEGAELANHDAAMARGIREARALAADTVLKGHLTRCHLIEVQDEHRKKVGVVRFDDAVEIRD
jgi:hypothetical protein